MARYIDADRLIDYIDENVLCTSRDSEECKQFMIEHLAMEWFAPTVDVVPKSEVAREIFEEIEKFMSPYRYPIISELKKKYTEEGK